MNKGVFFSSIIFDFCTYMCLSISRYFSCPPCYSLLEALPPEKLAFHYFNNQTPKSLVQLREWVIMHVWLINTGFSFFAVLREIIVLYFGNIVDSTPLTKRPLNIFSVVVACYHPQSYVWDFLISSATSVTSEEKMSLKSIIFLGHCVHGQAFIFISIFLHVHFTPASFPYLLNTN